jgi:hypothetical protein
MATILTKGSQVAHKLEAVAGTEESLVAADFLYGAKDHNHLLEIGQYERGTTRGTHTEQPSLKGSRLAEVHFTQELLGGTESTYAPWQNCLQSMGYKATGLKRVTVGTVSGGTFVCGQTIGNNATQGSATKTAIFVVLIGTTMVYRPVSGAALSDSETVYNYASPQVSAPVDSTPADAGYVFVPSTESDAVTNQTATVERRIGGERHTIVEAQGRGSLMLTMNEPVLLKSEYRGCPVFNGSSGTPRTGSPVVVPAVGVKPKVCKGMQVKLGTYSPPVLTKIEIDLGNTITDRGTLTDQDRVNSGNLGPRIGERKITAKIDPEYVISATFDVVGLANSGDVFEVFARVGDATDANGLLIVRGPQCQIVDNVQRQDRSGIQAEDLSLKFCGEQDDELEIYSVRVPA